MILRNLHCLPASLLALVGAATATELPYNPTRILVPQNGSAAFIFSPQPSSSQFDLVLLNMSDTVNTSHAIISTISSGLPFLSTSSSPAFIPLLDDEGDITVLSGDCSSGARGSELWRFVPNTDNQSGTWSHLALSSSDPTLGANFLSAGVSFSQTRSSADASLYVFGGMCPNSTSSASASASASSSTATISDWTIDATYSNNLLTICPKSPAGPSISSIQYEVSLADARGPPVAEAGLTITPLLPIVSNTPAGGISQQQNFVLLGGHTQQAFINMSQVALFSLPESSWSFLNVNQPSADGKTDLLRRANSNNVEPRSGHTAILTPDGTKIIVFGGWVGDISTAADPQLAVLELGQGYGGTGRWSWAVPSLASGPFTAGAGLYGHGATMLPGGVMMIWGGYGISGSSSASKSKRQATTVQQASTQLYLFNITSLSWISSYTNPSSPKSLASTGQPAPASSGLLQTSSQRAGLGAGLALGILAVAGILLLWVFYSRRLRQRRSLKEKELREMALGAGRFHSDLYVTAGMPALDGGAYPELRSASWGSRQERRLGTTGGDEYPWAPVADQGQSALDPTNRRIDSGRDVERTGLLVEVPSPTRGLRKSLHSRGPLGYGAAMGNPPSLGAGIHRIDEAEEENSRPASLKKKARDEAASAAGGPDRRSTYSDPFKDPPTSQAQSEPRATSPSTEAKRQREREVQGWVEDWSAAAAAVMDRGGDGVSRNTSKAESNWRTLSNLSENHSHIGGATKSGRGSPEKSDRTGSNLSERSTVSAVSIQRSVFGLGPGGLSRTASQRSASAGYALFAGAAAAMAAKVAGVGGSLTSAAPEGSQNEPSGPGRPPSRRSASLNMNSTGSSIRYGKVRDRSDTFTTAHTSHPTEADALLGRGNARGAGAVSDDVDLWATPPQSPVKERHAPALRPRDGSLGHAAGRAAIELLGSVKRVFTGTSHVGVQNRVAEFENRSAHNSPTKDDMSPEMAEVGGGPRRTASAAAAFLKEQRGARDWNEEVHPPVQHAPEGMAKGAAVRRKPVPGHAKPTAADEAENDGDGDWDVEAAVERRVVQVMFTVPKEKLRVVNADALSLLSKSDVDLEGGENEGADAGENKRVSTVREEAEAEAEHDEGSGDVKGKGKDVVR